MEIVKKVGLLVFGCIVTGGCALPENTVGDYMPAKPVSAQQLYPVGQSLSCQFFATAGLHQGEIIDFALTPAASETTSDTHSVQRWVMTLSGIRKSYLLRQDDGSVLITREDEYDDGVYALYDPPLLMLPAVLSMDSPYYAEHQLTIHQLENDTLRDRGSCSHQVELLGKRTISTPAGEFNAYIMKTTWNIKLGLASANVVAKTALVEDQGMVSSDIRKRILALGLIPINMIETLEYNGYTD